MLNLNLWKRRVYGRQRGEDSDRPGHSILVLVLSFYTKAFPGTFDAPSYTFVE